MNRVLYYFCLALLGMGIGLLIVAAVQDLGGVTLLDDPPWLLALPSLRLTV